MSNFHDNNTNYSNYNGYPNNSNNPNDFSGGGTAMAAAAMPL